jgi:hypothetical protein
LLVLTVIFIWWSRYKASQIDVDIGGARFGILTFFFQTLALLSERDWFGLESLFAIRHRSVGNECSVRMTSSQQFYLNAVVTPSFLILLTGVQALWIWWMQNSQELRNPLSSNEILSTTGTAKMCLHDVRWKLRRCCRKYQGKRPGTNKDKICHSCCSSLEIRFEETIVPPPWKLTFLKPRSFVDTSDFGAGSGVAPLSDAEKLWWQLSVHSTQQNLTGKYLKRTLLEIGM